MRPRTWTRLILTTLALSVPAMPTFAQTDWRGRPGIDRNWQNAPGREAFERGYQEGIRQGEQDARSSRAFGFERDRIYRDGDRGYNRSFGSRDVYRNQFRNGFADGYRAGFSRIRGGVRASFERGDRVGGRLPGGYQDPAFARGFSDGFDKGLEDARDHDRYDPVRHGDYRSADNGYRGNYGSKDAYKNNYRTGFRQGYEQGYRDRTGRWR